MYCIQYKDWSDQDDCYYIEGGGIMVCKGRATTFASIKQAIIVLNMLKIHM